MNVFILALQPVPSEEINFGMLLLRMVVFLALVIALIWVILRKFLPMLAQAQGLRARSVRVLERVPLDQKRSLVVVEVQERVYLLGAADGQINLLMELDRDKMKDVPAPAGQSFDSVLKKIFSRSQPTEPPKS